MAVSVVPNISLWKGFTDLDATRLGYERVPSMVDQAGDRLNLELATRQFLQQPRREHIVNLPVRMDDGRMRLFRGYRIQHNDAMGPCQGTVRFDSDITPEALRAQAMYQTFAFSVMGIPLGGSVGAILCDPEELSTFERERLSREWVRQVYHDGGFQHDLPAISSSTDSQSINWMLDELDNLHGSLQAGPFTSQTIELSGILGRMEAQGYGAVLAARDTLLELGVELRKSTACVHGLGEVGRHAIRMYNRWGGTVVSIVCRDRKTEKYLTIANEDGIELSLLEELVDFNGHIDQSRIPQFGYRILPGDAWLEQNPDLLMLTTDDEPLELHVANRIPGKVKVIVEAVPSVIGPDADETFNEMGIIVVPDLVAASGGMIHGFIEQTRSAAFNRWDREKMLRTLEQTLSTAHRTVRKHARARKLSNRDAAYDIAVGRIVEACGKRGWI
jgi:glutamate dehydrogenase (NAD(P)+)